MTTQAIHFENFDVELSQPLKDRPDVVLITASDGRRSILGDGRDPFSADEYRQIDRQNRSEENLTERERENKKRAMLQELGL